MGIVANSVLRGGSGQFIFLQLVAIAFFAMGFGAPAFAEDAAGTCEPVVARVVSIQGTVEVRRRAGAGDWLPVNRLDTSICAGDLLRTGPAARAAIYVQPETLVRVDRNTTIALTQTPDETVVEFFQDAAAQ